MPVILIRTADGNFRLTEQKGGNYTIAGKSLFSSTMGQRYSR